MIVFGRVFVAFNVLFLQRISYRYENEDASVRFAEAQLAEIRKSTLAKIICENLEVPGDMQRAAFDLPSSFL